MNIYFYNILSNVDLCSNKDLYILVCAIVWMNANAYKRIQMNTNGFKWIQININKYKWMQMNANGCKWKNQMNIDDYKWIQMITNDNQMNTKKYKKIQINTNERHCVAVQGGEAAVKLAVVFSVVLGSTFAGIYSEAVASEEEKVRPCSTVQS